MELGFCTLNETKNVRYQPLNYHPTLLKFKIANSCLLKGEKSGNMLTSANRQIDTETNAVRIKCHTHTTCWTCILCPGVKLYSIGQSWFVISLNHFCPKNLINFLNTIRIWICTKHNACFQQNCLFCLNCLFTKRFFLNVIAKHAQLFTEAVNFYVWDFLCEFLFLTPPYIILKDKIKPRNPSNKLTLWSWISCHTQDITVQ